MLMIEPYNTATVGLYAELLFDSKKAAEAISYLQDFLAKDKDSANRRDCSRRPSRELT